MTGKASCNVRLFSFLIRVPKCQENKLEWVMATHMSDSEQSKHNLEMPIYLTDNLEILVGKIKTEGGGAGRRRVQ